MMRWTLILRFLLVLVFLAVGLILVIKNHSDRNGCWMTHMWGRIGFVRVPVDKESSYSLLIYGENRHLQRLEMDIPSALSGIPIVFVPGNAGSGFQARSLGSVLYNKTIVNGVKHSFDMFALDFNEELSGLSVDYMKAQSAFLEKAVRKIRSLYRNPPKGFIFLGHSMGGVVIRSLLLNPRFDPSIMAAVITLASPHKESPLMLSSDVRSYWQAIEDAWDSDRKGEVAHVPVISLSGGFKDDLIHEAAVRSPSVRHFSTTSLDRLWVEADHLCIVWCNQLVRLLSRFVIGYAEFPTSHKSPNLLVDRYFRSDGYKQTSLANATMTFDVPQGRSLVALAKSSETGSFISKRSRLLNHDWRIAEAFGPCNVTVSDSAVYDIVPTDAILPFSPTLRDIVVGFFNPIYTTEVKRKRITYLPVNLTDPTAVFKLQFEYTSCKFYNDSKYPTRMIFDIGSTRRYSTISSTRSQMLKMYKIDANDNGTGHVLIIANPRCSYKISISTYPPRTLMRPFQKHISTAVALFAIYCIVLYQMSFPDSSYSVGILILAAGFLRTDLISLVLISLLVIVVYEICTMLSCLLHLLLSYIKGFRLSLRVRLVLFAIMTGTAYQTHSFPVLCIAALINIRNTCNKSLRNLFCAIVQLSIVPFVIYVWNLTRYGYITGLFPDHNLISTTLILLRMLLTEEWPSSLCFRSFNIPAFVCVNMVVLLAASYDCLRVFNQAVAILSFISLF